MLITAKEYTPFRITLTSCRERSAEERNPITWVEENPEL